MTQAIFSFVDTKWLVPCSEFAVLCKECAKTHEIRIAPIDPGPLSEQMTCNTQTPARPNCEECGREMHEYATEEGRFFVSGWACDECGWSFDTARELVPSKD